ncbi:DUF1801 domain-containing protein [Pelagimonas varians]|uniref:YdhG-like domain-containing protein n=1 Tax=Pelagimonas varians TaxID=696760 RepID=A0A238JY90_9RHOB|nr:DUF1801 domain-containing protein [Pelagimonas varians]PYG33080.1 uncharacterized protein DUF1801 [Pelagimonas varians]SMX35620.1 hypothetical protein PEV8663_00536 [Pelagimonas varians]
MDAQITAELDAAVVELLLEICPEVRFVPKYGGKLFEAVAGDASSQFGGYFFYKNHMNIEFTKGVNLADPTGILHGAGKLRRHIKITSMQELQTAAVRELIGQAADRA